MNSPQNKIFKFVLEYWPIPFGVLQTCCKIQKCKKIIFVVFKKSIRKHIFKTSNIFLYKKECSKHVRVLVVCMKTFFFISICIFVTLHQKTRYSKYEIDIFYSIKKISDLKINMVENHKSFSLSFIFWRKKKVGSV